MARSDTTGRGARLALAVASALAGLIAAGGAQAQTTGGGSAGPAGPAGAVGSAATGPTAAASTGSGPFGAVLSAASAAAQASPYAVSLVTGLRAGLTYSDNPTLRPRGSETPGFIAEVSPYAQFNATGSRVRGSGTVAVRNFFRTEGDRASLGRLEANGVFTAKLYDDWLWLDANGRISNISASPIGPLSYDSAASGVNTTTVRTYSLSPYVRSRTPFFDYELRYLYSNSNLRSAFFGQTQQAAIASANTGTRLGRWSLGYLGSINQTSLGDGRDFYRRQSTGTLAYSVNPELRVGATVSYEQIDNLRGTDGRDYGVGPGAFVDWRPNSRFSLSAQTSRRYYGDASSAAINWRTRQSAWNLTYTRSVLTSADASLLFFDPNSITNASTGPALFNQNTFNPLTSQLLQQSLLLFGLTPLDLTLLSNALVLDKRLIASGSISGQHNSLFGNVFYNTRDSVGSISQTLNVGGPIGGITFANAFTGSLRQRGFTVGYQHRLDAASSVNLTGRYTDTELNGLLGGSNTPVDTSLAQLLASYSTRLTTATTATVGLRRTQQRYSGQAGASYDENAVFGTLDTRF